MRPPWIGIVTLMLIASGVAEASDSRVVDAAERADWTTVHTLAKSRATVNASQPDGMTALLWAAHYDDQESVALLLAKGADVNAHNRYGVTALSSAALNGNAAIAALLIKAGADPNAIVTDGETALMLAARSGSDATVQVLLDHGAQVDARETWLGETALMWAAGENHADVVRTLVKHGADINAKSVALDWKDIKHGFLNSRLPAGGLTPLLHAARENAYEATQALLELGADVNLKDPQGISALRTAIVNAHLDLADLLLQHGADPNEGALPQAVKVRTETNLRPATNRADRLDVMGLIESLFAHGAQVDSVPTTPMPTNDAFAGRGPDIANKTALFLAAGAADVDLMREFIKRGADVNRESGAGTTVLMAALGAPTVAPVVTDKPLPASQLIEAGKLCLDSGAKINASNATGMTALHAVASRSNDEVVKFLVSRGARLDIKDHSNRTALDVAKGVAALPVPGAPPTPPELLRVHDNVVAALQSSMDKAGVRIQAYQRPEQTPVLSRTETLGALSPDVVSGASVVKKPAAATAPAEQRQK